MKITYKYVVILIVLLIVVSCAQEEMIVADPSFIVSFQRDGKTDALAGTYFSVTPTGAGEFLSLFDGTKGHVFGEEGSKGLKFIKLDSLNVKYSISGKYRLTVLATSSGNFGKEISRKFKTVDINVIDLRNSFTVFNINGIDGAFSKNNQQDEILFSLPDVTTDFKFIANFGTDSDSSKVYINGIQQITGITINDFSQPVVYTIKSVQGTEKKYIVKFSTFPSSSEKEITQFMLGYGGNGEIGVIDETNKIINLTVNYASVPNSVRLVLVSSNFSTILLNGSPYSTTKKYDLITQVKKIKVIAQNKTEVEYAINLLMDNPVTSFTFAGLIPAPKASIDVVSKKINVDVLKGTDITKLAAVWTGTTGNVTVGGKIQTNAITTNDFSAPVNYTFYKGATVGDVYQVIVTEK